MKKHVAITVALLLILLMLCACTSPEKSAEAIIKQQTGMDVNIGNNGETVTIKGENGENARFSAGGNVQWPAGKLGNLPKPNGRLTGVIEANGGFMLTFEDVSKADGESYVQKLKELGYSDGMEMKQNALVIFSGKAGDASVMFQYSLDDGKRGMGTLTYTPEQQ